MEIQTHSIKAPLIILVFHALLILTLILLLLLYAPTGSYGELFTNCPIDSGEFRIPQYLKLTLNDAYRYTALAYFAVLFACMLLLLVLIVISGRASKEQVELLEYFSICLISVGVLVSAIMGTNMILLSVNLTDLLGENTCSNALSNQLQKKFDNYAQKWLVLGFLTYFSLIMSLFQLVLLLFYLFRPKVSSMYVQTKSRNTSPKLVQDPSQQGFNPQIKPSIQQSSQPYAQPSIEHFTEQQSLNNLNRDSNGNAFKGIQLPQKVSASDSPSKINSQYIESRMIKTNENQFLSPINALKTASNQKKRRSKIFPS